jgi:hypothetical protein
MHSEAQSSLCLHWHRLPSARTLEILAEVVGSAVQAVQEEALLLLQPSQHQEKRMGSPFLGEWLARTRCGYLLAVAASAS